MRLIDADALVEILKHNKKINEDENTFDIVVSIDEVIKCVESQPTVSD